jgi:oligopeptide/dipeptide ABC transporter ATP-binding protein
MEELFARDNVGSPSPQKNLLQVENLAKYYPVSRGFFSRVVRSKNAKDSGRYVRAVDGISFSLNESEIFALVGESGCGKTTTAKMIVGLIKPTAGSIRFQGEDVSKLKGKSMKRVRKNLQFVFQDPYSSLDPRMTVGKVISEPLGAFGVSSQEKRNQVFELLQDVGLKPEDADRYPREFSGGQRQRIGIARALALRPKLIIADEPVSALDVSVRSQILNILVSLREKRGISLLLIAHDLSVVRHVADRVAVMHLGKIVELSDNLGFYKRTLHPYSVALIDAIPIPDPEKRKTRTVLSGELPDLINPPSGCKFHTRCPMRFEPCDKLEPVLSPFNQSHSVACHLWIDPTTGKPVENDSGKMVQK